MVFVVLRGLCTELFPISSQRYFSLLPSYSLYYTIGVFEWICRIKGELANGNITFVCPQLGHGILQI